MTSPLHARLASDALTARVVEAGAEERLVISAGDRQPVLGQTEHLAPVADRLDVVVVHVRRLEQTALQGTCDVTHCETTLRDDVLGYKRWLDYGPVLTAPVSAVQARCATVRARPGPFSFVKTAPAAPGGGCDGTEQAGTRSDGRTQGRNSADGCGEDRV